MNYEIDEFKHRTPLTSLQRLEEIGLLGVFSDSKITSKNYKKEVHRQITRKVRRSKKCPT